MKPATCHPDRPHVARGLCRDCYRRQWRKAARVAKRLASRRRCEVCGRNFAPPRHSSRHCSKACQRFASGIAQAKRDGYAVDSYVTTHDQEIAAAWATALRDRGFRRVKPKTARTKTAKSGPYWSAWKRSTRDGHHLYVVRWWSPAEAAAEDLEEAA